MKTKFAFAQLAGLFFVVCSVRGQGTLVYDQQSSASEPYPPGFTTQIQPYQPFGQSFVPALSSIGFLRLYLSDTTFPNGPGAAIYVNLRTDSITGPVIAATSPVLMPGGFFGYTNFFFPAPAAVTPGTTYYLQPVVDSGNPYTELLPGFTYSGGTAFSSGTADQFHDLWFREGIIVPEPSSWLLLIGSGVLFYGRRVHLKKRFAA
jgi:hypothetical protein